MTEARDVTISIPENVNEAVSIVDRALGSFMLRELVSASEVTDVLLDIRSALNKAHTEADEVTLDLSDVESEMEVSA